MPTKYSKREINKTKKDNPQAQYSQKQKFNAVVVYKLCGSLRATALQLGIPTDTISAWHKKDWWKDYETQISAESQAELKGNLRRVADKAILAIEDRLDSGDWFYDQKQSKLVRRPVSAGDANKIMSDSIDRAVLIENLQRNTKQVQSEEKIHERLVKLHDEFTKFARNKLVKTVEVIDVTPIEGGDPVLAAPTEQIVPTEEATP